MNGAASGSAEDVDTLAGYVRQFEGQLNCIENLDDPLVVFTAHLTNLRLRPSSSAASLVIATLEQATKALADDGRYKNDPRYLKLWMEYAKYCREPEDIFMFLAVKGIGMELAGYYEEYASFIEKRGSGSGHGEEWMGRVESVLRMGIERGAQPLERLKKSYSEFLGRIGKAGVPATSMVNSKAAGTTRTSWTRKEDDELLISTPWTGSTERPVGGSLAASQQREASVRRRERPGYSLDLTLNGLRSFEEVRAAHYKSRPQPLPTQKMDDDDDDDNLDDVPSAFAVPVNPEDLTHISVYRDNTSDLRELSRLAATMAKPAASCSSSSSSSSSSHVESKKENGSGGRVISFRMPPDGFVDDEGDEDPFEMVAKALQGRGKTRLSVIGELTEPFSNTVSSLAQLNLAVVASRPAVTLDREAREVVRRDIGRGDWLQGGHDGVVSKESILPSLNKAVAILTRKTGSTSATVATVDLSVGHYYLERKLDSNVLLAVDLSPTSTVMDEDKVNQVVIHIISPPDLWPIWVLRKAAKEANEVKWAVYEDAVVTVMKYYEQGSLRRLIEQSQSRKDVSVLPEPVALFYTRELIREVQGLWRKGIVHGGIRPEHVLLRSDDGGAEGWATKFRADGGDGWAARGVELIGFKEAVDSTLLKQRMSDAIGVETWLADVTGIGECVGPMLTGKPSDAQGLLKWTESKCKYSAVWKHVINTLSNCQSCTTMSDLEQGLGLLTDELDTRLAEISVAVPSLKSLLTRQEIVLLESTSRSYY